MALGSPFSIAYITIWRGLLILNIEDRSLVLLVNCWIWFQISFCINFDFINLYNAAVVFHTYKIHNMMDGGIFYRKTLPLASFLLIGLNNNDRVLISSFIFFSTFVFLHIIVLYTPWRQLLESRERSSN